MRYLLAAAVAFLSAGWAAQAQAMPCPAAPETATLEATGSADGREVQVRQWIRGLDIASHARSMALDLRAAGIQGHITYCARVAGQTRRGVIDWAHGSIAESDLVDTESPPGPLSEERDFACPQDPGPAVVHLSVVLPGRAPIEIHEVLVGVDAEREVRLIARLFATGQAAGKVEWCWRHVDGGLRSGMVDAGDAGDPGARGGVSGGDIQM